jgi:hypothetical protein
MLSIPYLVPFGAEGDDLMEAFSFLLADRLVQDKLFCPSIRITTDVPQNALLFPGQCSLAQDPRAPRCPSASEAASSRLLHLGSPLLPTSSSEQIKPLEPMGRSLRKVTCIKI